MINLASLSPSKMRGIEGRREACGARTASKPFLDQPLACPVDRRGAGIECLHDASVAPALAGIGDVGLEQDSSFKDQGWRDACLC